MVAISFSVFKEKILNGKKRQTIRLMNTKWCRVFDKVEDYYSIKLQLYWKQRSKENELLMETDLKSIYPKLLEQLTLQDALNDGFESLEELKSWFKLTYNKVDFRFQYLAVIQW